MDGFYYKLLVCFIWLLLCVVCVSNLLTGGILRNVIAKIYLDILSWADIFDTWIDRHPWLGRTGHHVNSDYVFILILVLIFSLCFILIPLILSNVLGRRSQTFMICCGGFASLCALLFWMFSGAVKSSKMRKKA